MPAPPMFRSPMTLIDPAPLPVIAPVMDVTSFAVAPLSKTSCPPALVVYDPEHAGDTNRPAPANF